MSVMHEAYLSGLADVPQGAFAGTSGMLTNEEWRAVVAASKGQSGDYALPATPTDGTLLTMDAVSTAFDVLPDLTRSTRPSKPVIDETGRIDWPAVVSKAEARAIHEWRKARAESDRQAYSQDVEALPDGFAVGLSDVERHAVSFRHWTAQDRVNQHAETVWHLASMLAYGWAWKLRPWGLNARIHAEHLAIDVDTVTADAVAAYYLHEPHGDADCADQCNGHPVSFYVTAAIARRRWSQSDSHGPDVASLDDESSEAREARELAESRASATLAARTAPDDVPELVKRAASWSCYADASPEEWAELVSWHVRSTSQNANTGVTARKASKAGRKADTSLWSDVAAILARGERGELTSAEQSAEWRKLHGGTDAGWRKAKSRYLARLRTGKRAELVTAREPRQTRKASTVNPVPARVIPVRPASKARHPFSEARPYSVAPFSAARPTFAESLTAAMQAAIRPSQSAPFRVILAGALRRAC